MASIQIVDPQTFRATHAEFLKEEKQATRLLDSLAWKRRALPATKVVQPSRFVFVAPDGSKKTLLDLFEGRRQLIIYHFMLSDKDETGCTGCSFVMDHIPDLSHLHSKNVTFAAVAPAEINKINGFKDRMGWTFPFYSSKYAFDAANAVGEEVTWKPDNSLIGLVVFLRSGEEVLHTYATGNRGVEQPLLSTLGLLDLTPFGREEEKGVEWKLHDQY